MSNDIKSQPQPAPAALVRSPHSVNISQRADAPSRVGAANGSNVAQVFRPEVFDFSERVAAPELSPQLMSQPRKFAYPSLTKYKWSRPLLIDSDPPIEFDVTHRKQKTEKFLTGARTHIRVFQFSPFSFTQTPRNRTPLNTQPPPRIGVFPRPMLPWTHHHQPAISAISAQAWGRGE